MPTNDTCEVKSEEASRRQGSARVRALDPRFWLQGRGSVSTAALLIECLRLGKDKTGLRALLVVLLLASATRAIPLFSQFSLAAASFLVPSF